MGGLKPLFPKVTLNAQLAAFSASAENQSALLSYQNWAIWLGDKTHDRNRECAIKF